MINSNCDLIPGNKIALVQRYIRVISNLATLGNNSGQTLYQRYFVGFFGLTFNIISNVRNNLITMLEITLNVG